MKLSHVTAALTVALALSACAKDRYHAGTPAKSATPKAEVKAEQKTPVAPVKKTGYGPRALEKDGSCTEGVVMRFNWQRANFEKLSQPTRDALAQLEATKASGGDVKVAGAVVRQRYDLMMKTVGPFFSDYGDFACPVAGTEPKTVVSSDALKAQLQPLEQAVSANPDVPARKQQQK